MPLLVFFLRFNIIFRYAYQQVTIEVDTLEIIKEHLSRRQTMDGASRNLLRLMVVTSGYIEVRSLALQRLEIWLQNPKVNMYPFRDRDSSIQSFSYDFLVTSSNKETYLQDFPCLKIFPPY